MPKKIKVLITFYSRTGNTRKLAKLLQQALAQRSPHQQSSKQRTGKKQSKQLQKELQIDFEEIHDTKNRLGLFGYFLAGRDVMLKRLTKLQPIKYQPSDYDLVIIGTPIWLHNISVPVRTYLTVYRDQLKAKKPQLAYFCTMGSSGWQKVLRQMERVVGRGAKADLSVYQLELLSPTSKQKVKQKLTNFVKKVLA